MSDDIPKEEAGSFHTFSEPVSNIAPTVRPTTDDAIQRVIAVLQERTATYGENSSNFNALRIGRVIRAILESHWNIELPGDIPPSIVNLIFAARKLDRAARPGYRADDHIDLIGYALLSEIESRRENRV